MSKRVRGTSMLERMRFAACSSGTAGNSGTRSQPLPEIGRLTQSSLGHSQVDMRERQSQSASMSNESATPSSASGNRTDDTSHNKKPRGSARPIPKWGTGERLEIQFNSFMQPVGPNAEKLMSQIGVIVRNGDRVPLTYVRWTDMPIHVLDDIWREVKDNTNAPNEFRDVCLKKASNMWRDWKARLKFDYFIDNRNDPQTLVIVPPRVVPDQWRTLVQYWSTEAAEEMSVKNKSNCMDHGLMHRTGRTSFANLRKKMEKEGQPTDRVSVFIRSRTNKKGVRSDEAADLISNIEERLSQTPESEQTPELRERIFTDVMGFDGHGRVRTYGIGPSPTDVFGRPNVGGRPSQEAMNNLEQKIRNEIRAEFDAKLEEIRSQLLADVMTQLGRNNNTSTYPLGTGQIPDLANVHRPLDGIDDHASSDE